MADETTVPGVSGILRRKVFGVPVLVLALIFAAGLLYMAIRLKPAEEPAEEVEGGDVPEGDGMLAGSDVPIFIAKPPTTDTDDNPTIPDPPQDERTDTDWARDAIEWLIAGGASPTMATSAINGYLSGKALSMAEGRLRDKALRQFGAPPSGFLDTSTHGYKGPAVKQGEAPTTHIVRNKADDTFEELARLYYGVANADTVAYLRANNGGLPNRLRAGQQVKIPKFRTPKYYRATQRVDTAQEIARKNGTTYAAVINLNPDLKFPVKQGTRVRIQ